MGKQDGTSSRLDWVRVPIGPDAAPYLSVNYGRTVLVVARSVTTAGWLLEFLSELLCDTRVQVLFTVEDESPSVYDRGAHDSLAQMGVAQIPWSQATATRFDLAICATHRGSLAELKAPLIITPHGPGFGKPGSACPGPDIPVPDTSVRPATTVVLSHPDQARLFDGHPPEVRLLVAGDPAFDRLRASFAARGLHRLGFGVVGGRRLIVLSSTWGPGAQFGCYPDLSLRLARELPTDEYCIAMILHPNIWYGHSEWQVRTWLTRATDAGVILISPFGDEWRSAVLAADLVIMDHGSVGFYAAAIGTPVLLASFCREYLIESSPLAELGRVAPELDLTKPLRRQADRLMAEHDPERYSAIAERMFAVPGCSHEIMAETIYELIGLDRPDAPPRVLGVGPARPEARRVGAHIVFVETTVPGQVMSVRRFPAAVDDHPLEPVGGGGGRHLVVDIAEPDSHLLESAAVITAREDDLGTTDEEAWAREVLRAYPGCRMAAILSPPSTAATVHCRDSPPLRVRLHRDAAGPAMDPFDPAILASAVYALDLARGLPVSGALVIELGIGGSTRRVEVVPRGGGS